MELLTFSVNVTLDGCVDHQGESPTHVLPTPKTKPLRATGEQVFTDEQLWVELENDDEERQHAASNAIDSLAKLAAVRAPRRGTSFIYERHHIFDTGLFEADVLTKRRGSYAKPRSMRSTMSSTCVG